MTALSVTVLEAEIWIAAPNGVGYQHAAGLYPAHRDCEWRQGAGSKRTLEMERRTGSIVPWAFHRDGDEIRSFRTAWGNAAEAAGCPGAWFHDLRRTAVVNLARAGVPRSVAMKLTGHKTEAVYRRYAIGYLAALEEGVTKLARLHESRGGGTNTAQSEVSGA